MRLAEHRYRTISKISGQLIFVENILAVRAGELVDIIAPDGTVMAGEVLEIAPRTTLIQAYGHTRGLDTSHTAIVMTDTVKQIPLAPAILGRRFSGAFTPIDDLPLFLAEKWRPITGYPINPTARQQPEEFIETGLSAIDGLNTLVKGQKLPVFSCAGLPAKEVICQILKQARLREKNQAFAIVFVALGLTFHEYSFYMTALAELKTEFTAFINMAGDPVMERLLAPRIALTVAEYLAFDLEMDVLVIGTDLTNYCDALREIANAREELPGRRGYPGYMYSDLASLYERAGRIRGRRGSVTMLPVLTMPADDITHPVPDLTGYITEGQIVLSREMHRREIFPPIDVLPSLSRLMQKGIGPGRTREDHRQVADLLYKHYARGCELRKMAAIVGRDGMATTEQQLLDFAAVFEEEFINQGTTPRSIFATLDRGLEILGRFGLRA